MSLQEATLKMVDVIAQFILVTLSPRWCGLNALQLWRQSCHLIRGLVFSQRRTHKVVQVHVLVPLCSWARSTVPFPFLKMVGARMFFELCQIWLKQVLSHYSKGLFNVINLNNSLKPIPVYVCGMSHIFKSEFFKNMLSKIHLDCERFICLISLKNIVNFDFYNFSKQF